MTRRTQRQRAGGHGQRSGAANSRLRRVDVRTPEPRRWSNARRGSHVRRSRQKWQSAGAGADRSGDAPRRSIRVDVAQPSRVRRGIDRGIDHRRCRSADRSSHQGRQAGVHAQQRWVSRRDLCRLLVHRRRRRTLVDGARQLGAAALQRGGRSRLARRDHRGRLAGSRVRCSRHDRRCAPPDSERPTPDHLHLGHHRRPEGCGVPQRTLRCLRHARPAARLHRRGSAVHGAFADPRQRPVGDPRAVVGDGSAGRVQPTIHEVEAVGRVPSPRVHQLQHARWHVDGVSTASRVSPTMPTTRCVSS